jgi:hypothetical protein
MKTINPIQIWQNGQQLEAKILNAYAVNVSLGSSATFYYALMSETENGSVGQKLAEGNLTMSGEAYLEWEQDSFAWDWVAETLSLVITGDYVSPVVEPVNPTE